MDLIENLSIHPKRPVNIIFAGHVDSGKSTICGRILVDLHVVDERTLEKYRQQSAAGNRASWYLSWCLDLNPEEREKGKTTEVGTASFDLAHVRVNILDAPGHKQFVNEMIEGVSRADVGILIVSARSGEFETGFRGGQTKEHLLLLKAGNVEKLIVLVNKMDVCEWSKERYEEIESKVSKFTRGLFKDIQLIPVSGYYGDNIKTRKELPYYKGPSFLEYLDTIEVARCNSPCLTIIEKIKTSGSIVFYVKVDSGSFTKSGYRLLPLSKEDRIVLITNEDDVEVEEAIAGNTYKIKLKELGDEACVGHKLVAKDCSDYCVCNEFYAHLAVCDVRTALTVGYCSIMHMGMSTVGCKIADMFSMDKKRIRVARKGDKIVARIKLDGPVVAMCNTQKKDRFSLRDENLTIAAGMLRKIIN